MDTFGSLVDKLTTVNMKTWVNQEVLYEIRRLSFEEFQAKFCSSEEAQKSLYDSVKKCCDLNYQRNELIDEIDKFLVAVLKGEIPHDSLVQLKHKTY